ncbi:MAG: alpha/beta hydrolase [Coprobacillus sp.]
MKDIYYEVVGSGFPIVLLHGNGENHHTFDETVEILSKNYKCILIDSRYHGKSIKSGELSYRQMCEDVKNVVSELDINEYDVIGFSDGGIVGLLLSMQDSRLKHMVVIGANTKPGYIKPFYRYSMYLGLVCLLPFCIYNKKARRQFHLIRLMLKEPNIEYQQLSTVSIPALILAGQYDMIKEIDIQNIGESLPYGIVKIIKQGNHSLLRDSFRQTIKEIEAFLYACHQEE